MNHAKSMIVALGLFATLGCATTTVSADTVAPTRQTISQTVVVKTDANDVRVYDVTNRLASIVNSGDAVGPDNVYQALKTSIEQNGVKGETVYAEGDKSFSLPAADAKQPNHAYYVTSPSNSFEPVLLVTPLYDTVGKLEDTTTIQPKPIEKEEQTPKTTYHKLYQTGAKQQTLWEKITDFFNSLF